MKVIEVQFDSSVKKYKYLFLNPANFSINRKKPLLYSYGVDSAGFYVTKINISRIYEVKDLPDIVTSQIVLTDNNNNILVQKLGSTFHIEETTEKTTEKSKTATTFGDSVESRRFLHDILAPSLKSMRETSKKIFRY